MTKEEDTIAEHAKLVQRVKQIEDALTKAIRLDLEIRRLWEGQPDEFKIVEEYARKMIRGSFLGDREAINDVPKLERYLKDRLGTVNGEALLNGIAQLAAPIILPGENYRWN